MKIRILFFLSLMLFVDPLNGQEDNYDINGFSVGIVPSALLNVWRGYQGEINYGFADHFEISLNAGAMYGTNTNVPYSGYRIRPSVKYYFLNDYEENRFYVEAGYLHRVINEHVVDTYNMFQGAFFQDLLNKRTRTLDGAFALLGTRESVFSSRFYLDFGIGVGLGSMRIVHDRIEGGELIQDNFFSITSEGTSGFIILILHVSFGYDF